MPVLSDNARGALMMMGSMLCFTLNDAAMKSLSDELPLFQAIFLRGLASTVLLFLLAHYMGALSLRLPRRDLHLIVLRTLAEVGSAFFFVAALFNMPLANVSAILQALPLTVTLAGALFLGEAVGWRRLSAILIGFAGVMLIVRPGAEGFNVYSIYALIAVACVTLRDLAARGLSRQVPSMTVALMASGAVTVTAGIGLGFEGWAPLGTTATLQLGGAALLIVGGYVFSVSAMRVGEIAVIAPFRYTSLLWALLLGFLVFAEWPTALTMIGATVVVATGVYTFYRERRILRQSLAT
jgi:S-adenosylmethionine uptake transporter